jgi:hypothetical protein
MRTATVSVPTLPTLAYKAPYAYTGPGGPSNRRSAARTGQAVEQDPLVPERGDNTPEDETPRTLRCWRAPSYFKGGRSCRAAASRKRR